MYIGVDVGFSDTKAVFLRNGRFNYFKMPTAVAYAGIYTDKTGFFDDVKGYEYLGKQVIVGQAALGDALATKSFDFLVKYSPLLIYVILSQVNINNPALGLGLPLNYFTRENVEMLISNINKSTVDGNRIEYKGIKVLPQGGGILFDFLTDSKGKIIKSHKDLNGVVVDIGYNTVDVLVFEKGSAIKRKSGMIERFGITRPLGQLRVLLENKFGLTLNEHEIKEVFLKGYVVDYGKRKDLKDVINDIVGRYADEIIATISSRWDDVLRRSDIMIMAGGGAYYIKDYLPEKYQGMIRIPDAPEYANARGFLKAVVNN